MLSMEPASDQAKNLVRMALAQILQSPRFAPADNARTF